MADRAVVSEEPTATPRPFEEVMVGAYDVRLLDIKMPPAPDGWVPELSHLNLHDLPDGRRVFYAYGEVIDGHGEIAGRVMLYLGPVPERWDGLYTGFAVKP
jgi:hypothetical protein